MRKIKFLVMDVDGTLTDGKIYMSNDGEAMKAFNIKDGCGIKDILPLYNIIPVIITGRSSKIVENRCRELEIKELYQGVRDKTVKLSEILCNYSNMNYEEYSFENVAYIGDDLLDLDCMGKVIESGGVVGCPNDAIKDIIRIADFVSNCNGGAGAVREFIEWIVEQE